MRYTLVFETEKKKDVLFCLFIKTNANNYGLKITGLSLPSSLDQSSKPLFSLNKKCTLVWNHENNLYIRSIWGLHLEILLLKCHPTVLFVHVIRFIQSWQGPFVAVLKCIPHFLSWKIWYSFSTL